MLKSKMNPPVVFFIHSSNNSLNPYIIAASCTHYDRCSPRAIFGHICNLLYGGQHYTVGHHLSQEKPSTCVALGARYTSCLS